MYFNHEARFYNKAFPYRVLSQEEKNYKNWAKKQCALNQTPSSNVRIPDCCVAILDFPLTHAFKWLVSTNAPQSKFFK